MRLDEGSSEMKIDGGTEEAVADKTAVVMEEIIGSMQ